MTRMRNGKERHETLIPLRKASKLQRVAGMGSAHWSTRCVTQSAAAKRILGVPTSQFRNAWFTTPALREAGITTTDLKSASFAIQDLADKDGLEMLDLGEGTLVLFSVLPCCAISMLCCVVQIQSIILPAPRHLHPSHTR